MPKLGITEALDRLSSRKSVKYAVYLTAVIVFFALILLPPILGIIIKWNTMQQVLIHPELMSRALNAVANSFIIALFVSAIDVAAGIPMAWLITRGKSKWLNVLDTLADIPFIVPTAALGYSLWLLGPCFYSRSLTPIQKSVTGKNVRREASKREKSQIYWLITKLKYRRLNPPRNQSKIS